MTHVAPNSVQARDIASIVHPQTNLAQHLEQGPVVISRGQGIYLWDDFGQQFVLLGPAKYRKTESRFCDESVAANRLEGQTGRIGREFVIA